MYPSLHTIHAMSPAATTHDKSILDLQPSVAPLFQLWFKPTCSPISFNTYEIDSERLFFDGGFICPYGYCLPWKGRYCIVQYTCKRNSMFSSRTALHCT